MLLDFAGLLPHGGRLVQGAGITAALSLAAILAGAPLGMGVCALRRRGGALGWLARGYISLFRGTPLLVQLLVLFYVPGALRIGMTPLSAALLGLALNTAAFQAEIYRAGFEALPRGQAEAARALGLRGWQRTRLVLLPQVIRLVLPNLTSEAVDILKNSALVSVIAVTDLLRVGQQVSAVTYRPLEAYLAVAALYWLLTAALSLAGHAAERRLAVAAR